MTLALRLSLGFNLLLAGVIATLVWHHRTPSAWEPARTSSRKSGASRFSAAERTRYPLAAGSRLNEAGVAALEKMGVPPETLFNVVVEDMKRRSARHVLDLQKKYAPRLVPEREMRELVRQDDAEQIRELKAAFGEEGYREWDKEQTLRNLNRARVPGDELPMSDAEADQAYRLQKTFDQKFSDLQQAVEDGDADKMEAGMLQAQAQRELDQALVQLLGQQRYDALRGGADPTVEVYRTFGDLNPTPGQAQAVVAADQDYSARQAALTQALNANPATAANLAAQLQALSDAHDESLRQIFGAAAYDAAKQQNDPTYQTLKQFADVWELGDQDIQAAYGTLHAFQNQSELLRNAAEMTESAGQRVNWRDINAAIDQQRQQAEAQLVSQIGADRVRRLEENGVLPSR